MLPIGTLLNIGGKLVGGYMSRRRAISDQKHRVALEPTIFLNYIIKT